MSKPIHGGGVDRAMADLGRSRDEIADFSASINPLGVPPQVRSALNEAVARIGDYPEIDAESLRQDLAAFHHLPAENLLPGSGSTELIYLLPRVFRPRTTLLVKPCFGEYAPALTRSGSQINSLSLSVDDSFKFSVDRILSAVDASTDLVLLANPGNPSGVGIEPRQLIRLAEKLGPCRLLVDEAFADFCPERSLLAMVPRSANLLILRSLTKFYAIPGLRAGYLAGPAADISQLLAAREPWSISNLAIAAARACLTAADYQAETLRLIPQLREELAAGLAGLGLKVFPGEANYLLCRLPEMAPPVERVAELLRQHGILIRNCADFLPLDSRFLRVAVLGKVTNDRLLRELRLIFE
jgi:threonine-phosphate decarboxylase